MSSIIEGYNYDIFISYRQKDNKGDRWVSEFVAALKDELESTFKEEISVYFDINPHDGLLETHDVDASLKEKLKCLVFIPIISRTYCDPKSFAWEHEFKAFIDQASQDQFGLKVKLPGGNVASRVLPIQIHDLDSDDIKLYEAVLGGILRSLDFIFRSPGVNRPLKPSDDPDKNLNKIFFPDQINKVANAVKDVITCLRFGTKDQTENSELPIIELHDYNEAVSVPSTDYFTDENISNSKSQKLTSVRLRTISFFIIIILLGLFGLWGWLRPDSDSVNGLTTYSTIPVESTLITAAGQYPRFSISPDGRTIATSSEQGIQLISLSDFSNKVLEGTVGATLLAFSPDGHSLVFQEGTQIKRIDLNGTSTTILYSKSTGPGLSWGKDGNIYFSPGLGSDGIWRISSNGGKPEQLTFIIDSLGENAHSFPQLLPDSKTILFTVLGPSGGSLDSKIVIQKLQSGERKVLIDKAISGQYLSNGCLLYANNAGNIFTIPFDLRKLEIRGEPKAVLTGINTGTWGGAGFISVSETGNVIYLPRNSNTLTTLHAVDRSGILIENDTISSETLEKIGHGWGTLSISPSGDQIATLGRSFGSTDIWLINLETGDSERLTFNPSEDETPVWSPDGKSISYTSAMTGTRRQLLVINLDSERDPHLISTWPRHIHFSSWSPDSKWIAAYDFTPTNGTDIYAISTNSDETITIASSQANESGGQFSPDGRWLAYTSNETGSYEIYVVSFPGLEGKRQISSGGGFNAYWDRNGKLLYYRSERGLIAHPVEFGNEFKRGTPITLFKGPGSIPSPDGKKFYYTIPNPKRPNPPLHLITNWFQELETKE